MIEKLFVDALNNRLTGSPPADILPDGAGITD
jgi:hypothetical protein